jgi:hypothetical protein
MCIESDISRLNFLAQLNIAAYESGDPFGVAGYGIALTELSLLAVAQTEFCRSLIQTIVSRGEYLHLVRNRDMILLASRIGCLPGTQKALIAADFPADLGLGRDSFDLVAEFFAVWSQAHWRSGTD